jgi:hypothetical protein
VQYLARHNRKERVLLGTPGLSGRTFDLSVSNLHKPTSIRDVRGASLDGNAERDMIGSSKST